MDVQKRRTALDSERRLAMLEWALFGYSGADWHETGIFPNGAPWGKVGSMTHMIDFETKRPISRGYHEIAWEGGSRFVGRVGTRSETVHLPPGCDYTI